MPDIATVGIAAKLESIFNVSSNTILWGIIGSAVSMRFVPQLSLLQKITAVGSGTAMAVAGTPIAKMAFKLDDEQVLFGVAFFIGVFGLSLTASVFETVRNTDWRKIVEARLSGKTETPPPPSEEEKP